MKKLLMLMLAMVMLAGCTAVKVPLDVDFKKEVLKSIREASEVELPEFSENNSHKEYYDYYLFQGVGRKEIDQISNIVRMECRNANVQGKGAIDMSLLVRNSLRMRPDRIIVGEVRGKEVIHMIQAMNTGHDGSMSTGHANSVSGMLKRLEAMFLQAADIPVDAIRRQLVEGIDIIIHMMRMRDGSRRVSEISELDTIKNGEITTNCLYRHGTGLTGNKLIHKSKLEVWS